MNWDDAKYFLAVARSGQMLGAAKRLGVSQAKLSRRISSLEEVLDCKLFKRSIAGCELTHDGTALLKIASRVEEEFTKATTLLKGSHSDVSGTIRIGAPDGFGVAFLAKHLHLLKQQFPKLNVQLVPVPRSFSLSQREADIAIMIGRPKKGRLQVKKLTDYSLGLYASKGYLEKFGQLDNVSQLKEHQCIGYVDDLIFTSELNFTAEITEKWHSDIEISSTMGQFEAIRSGSGIGVLHDFMAHDQENLVRILPHKTIVRSYWTVWHESMKNTRRIAAVTQFLNDLVHQERDIFYPVHRLKNLV